MASFMLVPNFNKGCDLYKILKDEENSDVQKYRGKFFLKEALKLMNTNCEKRTSGLAWFCWIRRLCLCKGTINK